MLADAEVRRIRIYLESQMGEAKENISKLSSNQQLSTYYEGKLVICEQVIDMINQYEKHSK